VHDAKTEIMRDIDSFVASIRSVGEKNMDATASLETRCVKLEARMNENEHAANDETNVINQLKMNLANAERALAELRDDSERRFQEAEYAVDCLKEEVSDGFSARLVVCEARLDDDCPVGSRARRETALANLERKYATKAELEDLDLLVQKEHDKYKESLQANLKATEQARRAKEMDTAAMLSEHKSMLGKHAKMLENSQKKVEKIEKEKKTKEVEEAKKTDVFEKSTKELEEKFEKMVEDVYNATQESKEATEKEKKRQDAERSALAVQIYKQCDSLSERIDGNHAAGTNALESKAHTLLDKIKAVEETAGRTITKAEACEAAMEQCEKNVAAGRKQALQAVDEARRGLFSDLKFATDEFALTKKKTELEVARLSEVMLTQTKDYTEAMARLHRSLIAQAIAVKKVQAQCSAVCLKDTIGEALDAVLDEHVSTLSRHCVEAEAAVATPRPMALPYHEQRFLAASVQQCAEKLAMRADFECLRKVVGHADPETDDTWDDQLAASRDTLLDKFVNEVLDRCKQVHPTQDALAKATRHQFVARLELCIKIGMSKHASVQTNHTLFGRTKLGPTCVACDRPFGGRDESDDLLDKLSKKPRDPGEAALAAHDGQAFAGVKKPSYAARGGGFRQPKRKKEPQNDVISVSITESRSTPHLQAPGYLKPKTQEPDEMFFPKIVD